MKLYGKPLTIGATVTGETILGLSCHTWTGTVLDLSEPSRLVNVDGQGWVKFSQIEKIH